MGKVTKKTATVADLKIDPENARKHPDLTALKKSLSEFGAARSIVIDGDDVVRAGSGTVEAAIDAGITKTRIVNAKPDELVVVRRADLKGERAKAYALADNRVGELSLWDIDEVEKQLAEFETFTAEDVGFTEESLDGLRFEYDKRELDALVNPPKDPMDDVEVSDKADAGYKKMEFPCSGEQAETIRSAIRKAKKAYGVQVTGEALANICSQWIEGQDGNEPVEVC
jgi:hypothetical protein